MKLIQIKEVLQTKKFWYELLLMTLGMLIGAIGVHFFLVPSKLIIGSISGLSIVIFNLTHVPVSVVAFIINGGLLILAYLLIGKEFGLKTVYTALILSPWLFLLEKLYPISESVMKDPWFDLLCFVVIISFVQAVLFKINASTGGLDILAKIINKYFHVNIGVSVTFAGAAICCTAFAINDFRLVIIGLIGTWINGLVLNHFTAGLNTKKKVCIISKEGDRIKNFIINEINRGASLYEVKGGYSSENFVEVVTILAQDEFATLMRFIDSNGIKTFMTAGNVSEVYGFWNKRKKIKPTSMPV
ncbi:MAG: hypothetical protein CSB06_01865 [Bacteroidia bacterium]|nr:MAG: hypothetical protein CSB06_01865 [Bacteroidia bacterium]